MKLSSSEFAGFELVSDGEENYFCCPVL